MSRLLLGSRGQGTVEFAIVALVVFAMVFGLQALWSQVAEGLLVTHAADTAAHSSGPYQLMRDTFLF
jgi:Flp pilus assembly protein TadG